MTTVLVFHDRSGGGWHGLVGMGVGKIAAQVAHGAVDLYRTLSQQGPGSDLPIVLQQWELNGETKVVVGVKNEEALLALSAAAQQAQGVTCSIIQVGT
eukprot:SAG25_NODE_136_length_14215_cov_15.693114_20_plen_98_part_00